MLFYSKLILIMGKEVINSHDFKYLYLIGDDINGAINVEGRSADTK